MRSSNLVLIVAAVAATIVANSAAAKQSGAKAAPSKTIAAQIAVLVRRNASNSEIIGFADRQHSVRVVRGKPRPLATRGMHGSDQTDTLARQARERHTGGPVVAAVSVVFPAPVLKSARGLVQVVSFADTREQPVTVLRGAPVARGDVAVPVIAAGPDLDLFGAARGAELDRVAFAVDGAESSHGTDPGMWRADLGGPQGPMQVSDAAAIDSGGGNRFDPIQNRQLGRLYLAKLFRRYGNWPDAVAAYNWGPANMDAWIAQGRPAAGLPLAVERYCERVLRDGGILPGLGSQRGAGWQLQTP
ncbi:MAG: lytic transglycosylase domain-containing protein [Alphaproteobacteria bacterium]|nr:lytic transglycosylase domain-containing protein [Alphaproteobacteria bacterium]